MLQVTHGLSRWMQIQDWGRCGVNVLLLLAHNDDEYFCSLRISEELQLGNHIFVVYLTHGSLYGADSKTRIAESTKVLTGLGVNPADIFATGYEKNIFDCRLPERIVDGYRSLCSLMDTIPIDRIYVMAWEGGHPDHDASHMIGVAFARARNLRQQLYEFPAYNAARKRPGSAGVMRFMNGNGDILATSLNRMHAFRALTLARGYKTQRTTFLALLPGSIVQLLLRGYQAYRRVPENRDYTQPPHPGTLFYERRFRLPFARFIKNAGALYEYM